MNLVSLIIMVVGFLACGLAIAKWQRRKAIAERERMLKIAQGDFSREPQKSQPVRKRKRRKLNLNPKKWLRDETERLPSYVETELLTLVPPMVDQVLSTRASYLQIDAQLRQREGEYCKATAKVNGLA